MVQVVDPVHISMQSERKGAVSQYSSYDGGSRYYFNNSDAGKYYSNGNTSFYSNSDRGYSYYQVIPFTVFSIYSLYSHFTLIPIAFRTTLPTSD